MGTLIDADESLDDAAPDTPTQPAGKVRQIDIVDARVTGGPHANFPVLVALSAPWLKSQTNGGDVVRDDGADVFFSSDSLGMTRLDHEVEAYAPTTGTIVAWVRIPSLSAQTVFYVRYGDPAITTSQQNAAGVWTGYELVAHLQNGSDSTGKNTASTVNAMSSVGKIGNGMRFLASNTRIDFGSAAAVDNVFLGGGSLHAWFRADSFGPIGLGRVFSKFGASGWTLGVADTNNCLQFVHTSTDQGVWQSPLNSVALNVWIHAVVVYNKDTTTNNPTMYINGLSVNVAELASPSGALDNDAPEPLLIGNSTSLDRAFDGTLDELRVSSATTTAARVTTEYANQSAPTTFLTISEPL